MNLIETAIPLFVINLFLHGGRGEDHSAMVRALEKLANFEIGQKAG